MVIKIDLEKAYDRIKWEYIEDILDEIKLPPNLRRVIMQSISTTSMNVLQNGTKTEEFKPSRGIRQGDPLSPYLFVLCMDKLSHIIEEKAKSGNQKPIKAGRKGPSITHLMFADDLLLFAEASIDQIHLISKCLEKFCLASGQKVNIQKTRILFSKNVHEDIRESICQTSGFAQTSNLSKYLGINLISFVRSRRQYIDLVDKIK